MRLSLYVQLHISMCDSIDAWIEIWKSKIRSMSADIWDHTLSNEITLCKISKFLCERAFTFVYIWMSRERYRMIIPGC